MFPYSVIPILCLMLSGIYSGKLDGIVLWAIISAAVIAFDYVRICEDK